MKTFEKIFFAASMLILVASAYAFISYDGVTGLVLATIVSQ